MKTEHWIALGVAILSLVSAVIVSLVNKYNELKLKKFEYKSQIYFQYLSSCVVPVPKETQTQLAYLLMLVAKKRVVKIIQELHFGVKEPDPERKTVLNRKLIKYMRLELHSRCEAKVIDGFPDSVFEQKKTDSK